MKGSTLKFRDKLKQPWVMAVLFATLIPLLPEYFAPILAALSLVAAYFDSQSSGQGFRVGAVGKILLIYIAYLTFGILYSPEPISTLATAAMWAAMFMVYLSLTTVLKSRHRFDTALFAITLIAGLIGFIGCFQYMMRVSLGFQISDKFWSFIDDTILPLFPITIKNGSSGVRISSTFNNCNIFGEAMVVMLPIVTYYSFYGRREKTHLLSRFCLMMVAGGIAFSFSRGSYLGLIVIALVFTLANFRKIVYLLLTLISAFLLVPQPVIARLLTINDVDNSVSQRMEIWAAGASFIKENPLFGVGAGINNSWNLLLQQGIDAPHMHSLIIQLIVEGGIIALVIFAILSWKIVRPGFSMLAQDGEARMIGVMLVAFLAGFFTDSLFDFPFMTPKLVGIFLIMMALADSASRLFLKQPTSSLQEVLTFQKQKTCTKGKRITCSKVNDIE
ncbi:MAG: O-antigen ligase family protein [Oscillospiraceae bacterium]|nr:O-antigen ligase family protein [Oscillospiraceae bacterium]MDD4414351.1 O-antigen ligase family protein [Oscillospiraceae bacterium]